MTDASSQKKLSKCDRQGHQRLKWCECTCVWMWDLDSMTARVVGNMVELIGLSVEKWKTQPAVRRSNWVAAATAATTTATAAATAAAFHEHSIMQLTLTIICWPFAGFFGHAAHTSSAWWWQSILRAFRGGSNANISRQTSQLISPQAISV